MSDTEFDKHINSYTVASLEDYFRVVSEINEISLVRGNNKHNVMPLWYRGHKHQYYNLIPTLLRESKGLSESYCVDHLREDYRYQHFRSKCNQLVERVPKSRIEWTEIMQHFCAFTRMMDWSESAITALMFALEYFIEPGEEKGKQYNRSVSTPTVWVLDPVMLNSRLYDSFLNNTHVMEKAFQNLILPGIDKVAGDAFISRLVESMKNGKKRFFMNEDDSPIQGIVCLAALDSDRVDLSERMYRLLESGEYNPFFYLLLRYFADGLPVEMPLIPPLAIVHPYHSNRIQVQHGVFTVTPHYKIEESQVKSPLDRRPMEMQPEIKDCLYKIRVIRPAHVAKELLIMGKRRTLLYPEMDNYAKDIEVKEYMV